MKSSCERCESNLRPDSCAYICSYECTFCGPCFDKLNNICPNCGGELLARPKRGTALSGLICIEKFNTIDFEELVALFDGYRQFYGQTTNLQLSKEFLERRLINQESVIFVARRTNKLVGFAQLYPMFTSISAGRTWILNDLYVDDSARTLGAGTELIKRAIEFAKESKAFRIILETAQDNLKAQSIYRKLGFKQVEKILSFSLDF